VATGEIKQPDQLIRFALSPDGDVTPDIGGKLPGRGVWVSADRVSLEAAIKTKGFARGFKRQVQVQDDLVNLVETLLRQRALGLIRMALKSGNILMGFDQVKAGAQSRPLAWRIEALDGSADGRGKIRVITKAVSREMEVAMPGVVGCFSSDELGLALGRDRIVHMALKPCKLSRTFGDVIERLSGFVDLVPNAWPDKEHETSSYLVGIGKA